MIDLDATGWFAAQMPLFVSVLSASLLGSLHCAGMCGPLVTVYAVASRDPSRSPRFQWSLHAAYHLGRGVTYAAVGALGGAVGSFVDWAGEAAGLARVAALLSSLLLIVWGLSVLFPRFCIRTPWDGIFGRRLVQLKRRPPLLRASLLGSLSPLLPCGWFYAFAVTAAGTGSYVVGAMVMTVFWAGTVPALVGMGAVATHVGQAVRARLPLITGTALIVIGCLGVFSRMRHPLDLGDVRQSTSAAPLGDVPEMEAVRCH